MKTLTWTRSETDGLARYESAGGRFIIQQKRVLSSYRNGVWKTIWVYADHRDHDVFDVDTLRQGKEHAHISLNEV